MDTAKRRSKGDRFIAGFEALMKRIGAEWHEHGLHEWYAHTRAGRLGMTAQKWTAPAIGTGIIFCRFGDPVEAAKHVGLQSDGSRLNEYSGKWNFYYDSAWSAEEALANFEIHLNKVL